jgi:hypothetical protein
MKAVSLFLPLISVALGSSITKAHIPQKMSEADIKTVQANDCPSLPQSPNAFINYDNSIHYSYCQINITHYPQHEQQSPHELFLEKFKVISENRDEEKIKELFKSHSEHFFDHKLVAEIVTRKDAPLIKILFELDKNMALFIKKHTRIRKPIIQLTKKHKPNKTISYSDMLLSATLIVVVSVILWESTVALIKKMPSIIRNIYHFCRNLTTEHTNTHNYRFAPIPEPQNQTAAPAA